MARFTVFYSWQSDLPRKLSRDVIHRAASAAVARIEADASVEDAPRLDHDTQGVAGAPEISSTIFRKIDQCAVFLGDLTFVGATGSAVAGALPKKLPNANVLLELGYAASKIGWDRVILVMNTAYGEPGELIFDLRHRRFPLAFSLSDATRHQTASVEASLSAKIEEAIRATLQAEHAAVEDVIGRLDVHALKCLAENARRDRFSFDPPKNMGQVLVFQRRDDALVRLIELGLIRCEIGPGESGHSYSWTYFGKLVQQGLGRKASEPDGGTA